MRRRRPVFMSKLDAMIQHRFFVPAILLIATAWVLLSALSLSPVPWPDGSAFYLPALEIFQWPPRWRMHAQAAWVPSYDVANFNLMPGLPLYLGLFAKPWVAFGLDATQVIRVLSWFPFLGWATLFWYFMVRVVRISRSTAQLLLAAGFLDPVARWAVLVVRTEVWVACAALGVLLALDQRARSKTPTKLWGLPVALALGAYFHFEAFVLIPAAAWGLRPESGPRRGLRWARALFEVGLKTFILLSPWVAYVLSHWGFFWEQMSTQFQRLEHGNYLVSSAYLIFHSMFMNFGNIADVPKFFVLAKLLFWVGVTACGFRVVREAKRMPRLEQGALLLFAMTAYLWFTKGEVWFVSLVHWTFWPVAAYAVASIERKKEIRLRKVPSLALGAFILLCVLGNLGQQLRTPRDATWTTYKTWTDCLAKAVQKTAGKADGLRVFQPHVPDVLVRFSQLHPNWDLTRALDFPALRGAAEDFLFKRTDAVVFTRVYVHEPSDRDAPQGPYRGPLRPQDRLLLASEQSIPFGPLGLQHAHEFAVCQEGPFWGAVTRFR